MNPQSFFKWLSVSALLSVSIAAQAADDAYAYKMVSFNDGNDNFDGWVRSDGANSKVYSTRLPENYSKTWLSCWAFSEAEWTTDNSGNSTTCFPYKRPASIEVKKDTQSEWNSVTLWEGSFFYIPEGYDQLRVTFGSAPKAMTLGEAITQTEAIKLTDFPEMDILTGTPTDRGIMASGEQTQAVEISIPCTSASELTQAFASINYSCVYVQEASLDYKQTFDIGPTSVSATAVTTDNRTVALPLYNVITFGGRFYHEDACLLPENIAAIRIRWEFEDAPSYATDTEAGFAYCPIYVRSKSSDSATAETKFLTISQAAGPGNTAIDPGVTTNAAIKLTEPSSKTHYWIDLTGEGGMEYLETDHYSSGHNESHNVYSLRLSTNPTTYSKIGSIPFTPMTWMPSGKQGVMYTYDGFNLYSIDSKLQVTQLYSSSSKAALIDYDNDGRLDLVYPDIKKVVSLTQQGEIVESEFKVWTRAEYLDLHPSGGYDLGSGLSVIGGSTGTAATFHTFTQIDMNGDGYADFLDTQAGKCYLNLGDGSFVEDSFSGQIFLRDFDGDGQQDILRYNSSDKSFTIYYTGKSGSAAQKKLLSGLETNGHVWCYDFNRDGHTDLVIPVNAWKDGSGNLREDACIVLFLNDGKGGFKRKEAPFDGYVCFDDCADIDGDGYYEVIGRRIITNDGAPAMRRYTNQYISCRITDAPDSELSVTSHYDHQYTLYDETFAAPITGNGTLYYIGQWATDGHKAIPFPTQTGARPTKPAAPTATFDAEENEITITWESVSDPIVPAGDFTYELRIGTSPGADDLVHTMALADGTRRDLAEGNNGYSRTRKLNTRAWPTGNIYISVQAIDPSHRGSEFSSYTIARKSKPASDFDIFAPDRATRGDEITLKAKVNAATGATVSWEYGDATVISESANELRLKFATAGEKSISRTVSLSDGSTATSTHALTIAPVRFSAAAVQPRAAIDLDLDGTAEIIADGYFHEETPDGEITKLKGLFNNKSVSAAYFADINRDGYPDVLTDDGMLLNEGDRMMSYEEPDGYDQHWLLADFNNDGFLDAVGGNQYHLQENLGDYISFNDLVEYDASRSTSNLGDFNGDGLIDFRYGTTLYINNGDMTFRSEEFGVPADAHVSHYRDIDGDCKPDLFYSSVGNANHFPHIAWSDGSDTEIPQISGYDCNGWQHSLFDFDNNGCLDGVLHYVNNADSKTLTYAILFNADHSYSMVELEEYNARAATRYAADGAIHVFGNRMSGYTNTPPSAPDGLRSKTENDMLVIEWNPATDDATPQNMLRYVVSVKHKGAEGEDAYFISPLNGGKNGIPLASATDYGTTFYDKGTYQVCSGVNLFTAPIISIPLTNIPSGDYEVKVQAVDLQDMPSDFSATYEVNVNATKGYVRLPECTGIDIETLVKFGADTDPATIDFGQDSRVVSIVRNSAKVAWSTPGIKHITGPDIDATIEVIETPSAYTPLPPSVPYNSVLRIPQDPRFEHKWRIRANDGIGPRKPSFISEAATTADDDDAEPDNSFTELIVGQDLRGYIVSHTVTTPWGTSDSYEQTIMPDREITVAVGIVTINEDANKYEIIEPILYYSGGIEVTSKRIYRESEVTGQYELIGEVNYEDSFLDTGSAPESHASRYKVEHHYSYAGWGSEATGRSLLTNCKAAQPIHANISPGMGSEWNIVWTPYEGREVTSYRIMRGDSKSTLECIATVSGSITAYTDHTAPARRQFYAVETLFDVSATSREGNIRTARSNISDTDNWQSGIEEITDSRLSAEVIGNTLHVSGIKTAAHVRIIAVNGSEVLEAALDAQSATVAGFERLPHGVFLIVIDTPEEGQTVKRIIR